MTTIDQPAAIDPSRTLGELVAERPGRARVFEMAGIDYCCHGSRALSEAAEEAGVDVSGIAAELAAVAAPQEARAEDLAPAALAAHIEAKHHGYLHAELPLLVALADKVASVHGERHAELVEVARLVTTVRDDLEPHLAKEETFLFPVTQELAAGRAVGVDDDVHTSVEELMVEHVALGEVLGQLRILTDDYRIPADACASYTSLYQRLAELESDTFRHIHLENNVLFPAVERLAAG